MAASTTHAVLGLDTATDDSAVAITRGGELLWERGVEARPGERPRHANELLVQIASAVDETGGWDAIGLIAVGVGPGTFTGLRIGVATARALGQGLRKPLAPVGSLAVLDAGIAEHPAAPGRRRLAAIDARRSELFAALHDPEEGVLWEPFVASPAAIAGRLRDLEASPAPLAAGSGSLRFRAELEAAGVEVADEDEPVHRIRARYACRLADAVTPVAPEAVEPIYLRRPDAELWREQQDRDGGKRG